MQTKRRFGANLERVGEKLREDGSRQVGVGTNWTPYGRSPFCSRWHTLGECCIHVRIRLEYFSIIFGDHCMSAV